MTLKVTGREFGFQQILDLSASVGLTVPTDTKTNTKPTVAIIHAGTQAVRWRDDGTAPTATVGMRLPVGQELFYDGDLNKIRFIEEAASAQLNISYYN